MLNIDGSRGEGGGQVLRTALSLSAVIGRPFRIHNIRGQRSKPGLRPQHLTAVRAVAQICQAEMSGDKLNSTVLEFQPGKKLVGGEYTFDVTEASATGRSAGSVVLILQAVIWPLLFADRSSKVSVSGGTFVPFSPPFHYFSEVACRNYGKFGIDLDVTLNKWGWMSAGGGEVFALIDPVERMQAVDFEPLDTMEVQGVAAVSNLPSHIPHRMARRAYNLLVDAGLRPDIQPVRDTGAGPGAGIVLWLEQGGFSALGRKGLPADKVAETAVNKLLRFLDNGGSVDYHLADQLLLPMALANGISKFSCDRLTHHTLTNIGLLREWLDVKIDVRGQKDQPGTVTVSGVNFDGS